MKAPHDQQASVYSPESHHRLWRYGPLVLWAAVIFFFSSGIFSGSNTSAFARPILQWLFPNASEATLNFIHFLVIRKGAHLIAYFILGLFAARSLRSSSHEWLRRYWFLVSLLLVFTYSLTDEFHQSFVSTRTGSIYDSLIDTSGGLIALILIAVRRRRARPAGQS